MSFFTSFADVLARFKIGATALGLLHALVALKSVADQNLEEEKLRRYIRTQNILILRTVSLLYNLGESPATLRKMVAKDIVTSLVAVLERNFPELVCLTLRFIRRIAQMPLQRQDIPTDLVCERIVKSVFTSGQAAPIRESFDLLLVFAGERTRDSVDALKDAKVLQGLLPLLALPELQGAVVRLAYRLLPVDGDNEFYRSQELLQVLLAEREDPLALSLLARLSADRDAATAIAKSGTFTPQGVKDMFVKAAAQPKEENRLVLHMLRNLADSQPAIFVGFDNEILAAALKYGKKVEYIVDIVGIAGRSKMNVERAKFFCASKPLLELVFFYLNADSVAAPVHVEFIIFVGSLALFSASAATLTQAGLIPALVRLLVSKTDLDVLTQVMFAFSRLTIHTASRAELLKRNDAIEAVLKHSSSRNAGLASIAGELLSTIGVFDRTWAEKLKTPRFDAYNSEWMNR